MDALLLPLDRLHGRRGSTRQDQYQALIWEAGAAAQSYMRLRLALLWIFIALAAP